MSKIVFAIALAIGLAFGGAVAEAKMKGPHGHRGHHGQHSSGKHGKGHKSTCVPDARGYCTQPHI